MKYEINMIDGLYYVRPEGSVGNYGWIDNKTWICWSFNTLAEAKKWIEKQ